VTTRAAFKALGDELTTTEGSPIRLTTEQVARVLDAHEQGRLRSFGSRSNVEFDGCKGVGCIFEHAFQMRTPQLWTESGLSREDLDWSLAAFDFLYDAENGLPKASRNDLYAVLVGAGFAT
jgi:hypothetical protein